MALPSMTREVLAGALAAHRAGRLDAAEAGYRAILDRDPAHPDALHLLGVLRLQQGDAATAAELIGRAVTLSPQAGFYLGNLAEALLALGRTEEAVEASRKALATAPDDAVSVARLARCLDVYGSRLQAAGSRDAAIACYREAIALSPGNARILNNLGSAIQTEGDIGNAVEHYREALAFEPDLAPALRNLGFALGALGSFAEAVVPLRRLTELEPEDEDLPLLLGEALEGAGERAEALLVYAQAAARSGRAEARFRQGRLLRESGRLDEAAEAYRAALDADPAHHGAFVNLFSALNWLCAWTERDALAVELPARVERIAAGEDAVECLFPLAVELPYVSDDAGLHRRVLDAIAGRLDEGRRMHAPPDPSRDRIRLGYVSPDFGDHPISQVCRRVFALHDRVRFTVTAYSLDDRDEGRSTTRAEIVAGCDRFVSLAGLSDADAAGRIVADGVDLLVDLTGYLRRSRPRLFAARPAPVQVHWLGHAGGLAAPCIPYLIADATVVPPGEERAYAEAVVRLPEVYHVADRMEIDGAPLRRRDFGLAEDAFVFCTFNNPLKIDAQVFDAWTRILAAVPRSVLWLSHGLSAATTRNLRDAARARRIEPERLVFAGWAADKGLHLARHRLADLFLDTFRFNASSTTLDALWAGLPVLTRRGDRFPGRISASMLNAVGLPDLVCGTTEEYVARAVALAGDPAALATVRRRLWANRMTAPLFDTERFVRHLERAYEGMWRQAVAGDAPQDFAVEALP